MRFGRKLALCLLFASLLTAVKSPKVSAVNCGRSVGEIRDSAARLYGFGCADGYYACNHSKSSLKSSLPPQSFLAYKWGQARSHVIPLHQQLLEASFYDRFDSGCELYCHTGVEVVSAEMPSKEEGLPPVSGPVDQQDVSSMWPTPVPAITVSTPMVASEERLPAPLPEVEAMFKSFGVNVAIPEESRLQTTQAARDAIRPRGLFSLPAEGNAGAELVYPTLVAPPRAQVSELGASAAKPALRRLQVKSTASVPETSRSPVVSIPEPVRDYSTPVEADDVVPAEAASQRVWVTGASEDGPTFETGTVLTPQKSEAEPVMKAANRPARSVDGVIRQPGIQR